MAVSVEWWRRYVGVTDHRRRGLLVKLMAHGTLDYLRHERHVRHRPVVRHVRGVKSRPLQERGDDCVFL